MGLKKFTSDEVKWTKEDKEAYRWCVNHGIKISVIAAQKGYDVGSWKIRIVANNKEMISPGDYSRTCLLYTSPSPRDLSTSRMPSSA